VSSIVVESRLRAPAERVWAHAVSMEGVNHELMPLVRMTVPRAARGLTIEDVPLGEVAGRSVLLLGGVLPFDLHTLTLAEVEHGRRFLERSHSLRQRGWEQERTVEPEGDECRVTDRLRVRPRAGALDFMVGRIVMAVFRHRHRRLSARFGSL